MRRWFDNQKWIAVIMTMILMISFCTPTSMVVNAREEESWAIYWYLCGSDLESGDGSATADLKEMMEVNLPDNITVVVETGGAKEWQNEMMNSQKIERYVYQNDELSLVDSQPLANMGEEKTLEEFLTFCQKEYDADHKMLLFWNHGGTDGVAYDENYDYDYLTQGEISTALDKTTEYKFDIIGFDACLMASLDTALAIEPYAEYMIASEELESGDGWDYTSWMQALCDDPDMKITELGKIICDSFLEYYAQTEDYSSSTLSLTDLSKIGNLSNAMDAYGKELLTYSAQEPAVLSRFSRQAKKVRNFGTNSKTAGYTNLVDLGDLVDKEVDFAPESATKVKEALKEAVVYQASGEARQTSGLSIYYSLDNDIENVEQYYNMSSNESYGQFLQYLTSGEMPEEAVQSLDIEETLEKVEDYNGEYQLAIKNGNLTVQIDPQQLDSIAGISYSINLFLDEDTEDTVCLGYDDELEADWDTGYFEDAQRGIWGSLNGQICYMEVCYGDEDYNEYYVPVKINGDPYYLDVFCHLEDATYEIDGIYKEQDSENWMAAKGRYELKKGDVIEPIVYYMDENGDDPEEMILDKFTYNGTLTFEETDFPEGLYAMQFCIEDIHGNYIYTDWANFEVDDQGMSDFVLVE